MPMDVFPATTRGRKHFFALHVDGHEAAVRRERLVQATLGERGLDRLSVWSDKLSYGMFVAIWLCPEPHLRSQAFIPI